MAYINDDEAIEKTHNLARFFTENRHISWVLLVAVFLWGYYGYSNMPKRKDPNIPISIASVVTPWPGKTAVEVEQLLTYPIELRCCLLIGAGIEWHRDDATARRGQANTGDYPAAPE